MLYQQPHGGPIEIDWSHPLARGLIGAFVPGTAFNLADNVGMPAALTVSLTTGVRRSSRVVATGSYGYPAPASATSPQARLFDINVLTALVVASQDASANTEYSLLRANGSSAPSWGIGLHSGSFNGAYAQIGSFGYSPGSGASFGSAPQVTAISGDGTNAAVYLNGRQVGAGTYTPATHQYSAGRQVLFGSISGTGAQQQVRPALGLIWNRALSPSEIAQVSGNPWQLFLDPDDEDEAAFFAVAGITGTTGTMASAEGADSLAASGATLIGGSLASAEGADTGIASGSIIISGSAASAESPDALAASGSAISSADGTIAATEAQDAASGSGSVLVSGVLAAGEGGEALTASGDAHVSGIASASEQADTLAASGSVIDAITGLMSAAESPDTLTAYDAPIPATASGGVVGSSRDVHAFAARLDGAQRQPKATKAAKVLRRKQIEAEVLELLPDEPDAALIAPQIALAVYRKEAQAATRWTPVKAMQPVAQTVIGQAEAIEAAAQAAQFDASEAIRAMVLQWLQNDAAERDAEDEMEIEMLLMG